MRWFAVINLTLSLPGGATQRASAYATVDADTRSAVFATLMKQLATKYPDLANAVSNAVIDNFYAEPDVVEGCPWASKLT